MFLIPLFIILLGLGVIIFIVARKLPQMTNLDAENLPEERQTRKKKEILDKRFKMETAEMSQAWKKRLMPVRTFWGQAQLKFRIYVGKVERLWYHERRNKPAPSAVAQEEVEPSKLPALLQAGAERLATNELEPAEEFFIAAIKLNQQSVPAYRGLADTYLAKGARAEAEETYRFILRLDPGNDAAMIKLAEIAEEEGRTDEAIGWYQQAVVTNDAISPRFYRLAELLLAAGQPKTALEAAAQAAELEPKNPKYLDLLLESAILGDDKDLAIKAYHDLRLVNPDNQKLKSFKDRVYKL